MVTDQAVRSTMRYQITAEPEYLKAELFNRQTAEETREFLSAVVEQCIQRRCYRVLMCEGNRLGSSARHRSL